MFFSFSRPRYQVSVYRTIDPLVSFCYVHKEVEDLTENTDIINYSNTPRL